MHIPSIDIPVLSIVGGSTIVGFYAGGLARRIKLPSIIGYMVLGVIIGPGMLRVFDETCMKQLSFITEVSLGFVALSIGSELKLASLRSLGKGIIYIILAESFAAFFLVAAGIYALTGDAALSLILGSMAPASAPAGTVAVIQELKAKGSLTKALYAVVGFDDGLAIIIFGFAAALAKNLLIAEATGHNADILPAIIAPLKEIGLSILVGGVVGLVLCNLVRNVKSSRDIFIIVFGIVFLTTGLSTSLHLSLIMTNMVVGFTLANTRRDTLVRKVMGPISEVMPLMFILFFTLAGAHLNLGAVSSLGAIGVVYILARSTGLVGGAYLGGMMGNVDCKVKKYIGMGILSQAGVAIGLSLIVMHDFTQISSQYNLDHAKKIGMTVLTSITATCIFFEIIGPILTKIALKKAGEINQDD